MKRHTVIFFLIFIPHFLFAQDTGGAKVIDLETNQPIPYATIYYLDIGSGTVSDSIGNFSYFGELPKQLSLKISAIGYSNLIGLGNTKTNKVDTFYLEPSHLQLEEIIVSSLGGKMQNQTISNIESRQLSELNAIQPTTLGEAISNIPGVYQSTTGIGISKPIIRGLSGSRIVTYLNGLRIENQQWGGDHGMGVDEIGVGSVEIIKGPASLLFGADALGGVVYFVDESYANQNSFDLTLRTKFNSVTIRWRFELLKRIAELVLI
jgi:iron complex outermembrane receptor protein